MQLTFNNLNQIWSYVFTETLKRLGLNCAVICPGSRSTPLTVAFVQQIPVIEVIPILDERSAAFFALGQAKATGKPVVLVCTSGTAGANFYPAVIEARESRVPLLILTTDRPAELRNCHSGQTIDQVKLYGNYPNWQTELATPSLDMGMLSYLRQTVIHAWECCQFPNSGAVHLNIPFRDPLAPIPDGTDFTLDVEDFFGGIVSTPLPITNYQLPITNYQKGIIIAGVAQGQNPDQYCRAIANLCQTLQWPVLAEGLSPVRNYANLNPYLISTYDLILRNQQLAKELTPEIVIQIGEMPTSKELRNWLIITNPQRWLIDKCDQNLDPIHGKTTHLRISITELENLKFKNLEENKYLQKWCKVEKQVRTNIDDYFTNLNELIESKVPWLISQILPPETPIFIANSMPVRDVEFFWKPNNLRIKPYFNRGANGIDGTLSTALGIAHHQQSSVMLTGDLSLLHDTNGFLISNKFSGHLTIILINNNGGGIFEMLPISQFNPPFEEFFATPQNIDFSQLCATYNVEYHLISAWEELQNYLKQLPKTGIRVLEVRTNRKRDVIWRKENLVKFANYDF
ncbi:2-succinyl-5-enolpyruvyl-6-hydroxy-3-cyclohexene-1-carboxylic-acid synthase [Aphanizomenon flos-aquae NRERC-008]|jgi:2-succinyl-5-enolpyruvyl-6-hydroxy-3-cyclohexene-1-carboxylate synthase|uniref:2-succinyl-5-enolpyruvyl-6-hydroxy-3-cyclohexene-1-carboxylate synthase n=1 Tax=Aphanizomenon flos-aquae FACHB-1249 TaxID=2692889 RepID=A0ABR8IRY4_APHFL|nr:MULTISPECIES: 2-succinyl-5-enolpyruvyl-6-hydroxy-3-cyclohexene-1-carboxylic-acid synthase [Aphanizomenon]MBD2390760.1 2-succinyl-5-enolpyruvyl-6-hydroxy-3-cyclohexene-1-carboxylic-acid synthase [Aphanizomenon flos-aquae FACHB-1171]MBD2556316.1 2-succinyl-5-enolpyruvyl-6-hydroxy-3-cyclohexene-1-carboxylic-acid synthase [Aphanizomenon flos-aquae FACHB-1290]MBD2631758.1 2-succinyl-5-enolpyruvyl-6-hydroxy-3-cyclohexene-1-carboxylic-acid synthase [Aphanizomenon sp. FACHB-1399]MBD2642625.1 2-succi